MADTKKGSKPTIQSRGISIASAVEGTGGAHRGNPYHAPDGRFSSGDSALPPGAALRMKPVAPHSLPAPRGKEMPKREHKAGV